MSQSRLNQPHKKRMLAIGDIHGCLPALLNLERLVRFTPDDTIILLGDYIDRGTYSKEVIDWILDRKKTLNLITLLGNHEIMMGNASISSQDYLFWVMNGGDQTIKSFGTDRESFPKKYWDFLDDCKLYYETEKFIFVHAGTTPDTPVSEQNIDSLCWLRFHNLKPHQSQKIIICGHTPQRTYLPNVTPHAICIDTHVFAKSGRLTCLDVHSGNYWQASNYHDHINISTLKIPSFPAS